MLAHFPFRFLRQHGQGGICIAVIMGEGLKLNDINYTKLRFDHQGLGFKAAVDARVAQHAHDFGKIYLS